LNTKDDILKNVNSQSESILLLELEHLKRQRTELQHNMMYANVDLIIVIFIVIALGVNGPLLGSNTTI